jgi:hypothetical protein
MLLKSIRTRGESAFIGLTFELAPLFKHVYWVVSTHHLATGDRTFNQFNCVGFE